MRLSHRWLLVAVAVYLLSAPLVPLLTAATLADMEAPFTEGAAVIWGAVLPISSVLIIGFGAWLMYRGGPAGIVVTIAGALMLIYFLGSLPDFMRDAGMEWRL